MELLIKNMVCDRCIRTVREELEKSGEKVLAVELGKAVIENEPAPEQLERIRLVLEANGFELIDDRKSALVDFIRKLIIEEVQHLKGNKPEHVNFSEFLAQKTGYDYSYISNLFSSETGQTIEQYIIAQRVEKIKEWLSYGELSISEIAWRLGYSSVAHLSNQFKKATGMSPAAYRNSKNIARIPLDKVGLEK